MVAILLLILAASPSAVSVQALNSIATLAATGTSTVVPTIAATGAANITIHVVQRGENLFRIAQRYGTTVQAVAAANGLTNVTMINVGQRLLIPNASADNPGIPTEYVVQPDDSLFNLSLRYGTTMATIGQRNRIVNPALLYAGMPLALQEGPDTLKTGWLYTVQPEDNLYRVAARFNISIFKLGKANQLTSISPLFPGQRLAIPGADTSPALADVPAPFAQVKLDPAPVDQGRTFMLNVTTTIPVTLSGSFLSKPLVIHNDDTRTKHMVITGIDSLTAPGLYPLELIATDGQNHLYHFSRTLSVEDGGYASEAITLDSSLSDLINPKITVPEANKVLDIVSKFTPTRAFSGPMGLPCSAPITSQFGTRRSYNGGPYDQVHTGTDFAGAPGAAILAPAAGVVVFTGTLTVRGNATIIDHGWGIYTGYWHQSEIKVKIGDIVQQGQLIGLIGNTGRVTGPHLHWELFIGGIQVDPLQWVRQSF